MGYFDTLKNLEGIRQRENQNALARQAGGMLSQGDQTGARNALWRGGELDAGFKIEEGMASSRKAQAEAMERFTTGVSRMLDDPSYANDPNGADRAWNDATQFASQLGLNPDALNQDRDAFLKNPKGWANFWNQKAKEEQFTLSPGSARYDAAGRVIASQPFAPQYRTVGEGQSLVEVGGENGNPIPGGTPGFNPSAAISEMEAGGARVTSTTRTPERNRAVGGVPTSRHMSGEAVDLTPGPGQSMAQLAQEARRKFPDARVINEGDHVHVQWGKGGAQAAGGARVVAQGAPKPRASQAPPSGYKWNPDGTQTYIPGGPADPATKARQARPIPGPVINGYNQNVSSLTKTRKAIEAVRADPDAFGLKNHLGDTIMQRADPQGVKTRALIADIGSLKIHDRSGAAVSAKEFPRLKPFVPNVTDTAEAIVDKLQNFEAELSAIVEETEGYYNEDSGYRPLVRRTPAASTAKPAAPKGAATQGGIPTLTPEQASKLPKGARFRTTDGRVLVRQ